eukprot:1272259-Karenia_brevis.AAC.1
MEVEQNVREQAGHDFKRNQCVRDRKYLQCHAKVGKKKWSQLCRGCGAFTCSAACMRTYAGQHECSVSDCVDLIVTQRVEESRADHALVVHGDELAIRPTDHE